MPVTCTPDSLATEAACFAGLNPRQQEAIKIYLLAGLAGVVADPEVLAAASACFAGISPPDQQAIQTYLLCQIANA